MISIIPGEKVSDLDSTYTKMEGISSTQLMERAGEGFCKWFRVQYKPLDRKVYVFCGPGNNGGDGLVIARILHQSGFPVTVFSLKPPKDCSDDFQHNYSILPMEVEKKDVEGFDGELPENSIVIDAVLGVGINRTLEGKYKNLILKLNELEAEKISVDIPTGMLADGMLSGAAFKADFTITFQFPKLSLLFPEHAEYAGKIEVIDIGIPDNVLKSFGNGKSFIQKNDIPELHRRFHQFSHKGDFGRVMLIGGSKGKMGSIILSSMAALRTGSGLVVCNPPESENYLVQIACSELMVENDSTDLEKYDAIGIGPGWGVDISESHYKDLLTKYQKPVVIDADGINLISKYPRLLESLPKGSILTPHLKEFERMVGKCNNHLERLQKAEEFSKQHQCILVLKGAFTVISMPNGNQLFNSSGTKYMATAGSGDVLTGMITSFLGQGYSSENAAICGVFHHGLAGELASVNKRRGMIAGDIIEKIPGTFVLLDIT